MTSLDRTFDMLSPRVRPQGSTLASIGINGAAMSVFLLLVAQIFGRQDLGMWSIGIVYILYDTALLIFTAINIRRLGQDRPPALVPGTPRPGLGIIVAAYNEAPVLGITIGRLMAQDDPPDQIIIADDGSTDDTARELARLYGLEAPPLGEMSGPAPGMPNLRWLRLPHGGKARALNGAVERIETELMLTVDADTLLAPGALRAMRDAFAAEPELVAATGVLIPACGPHAMGRLFQWFQRYEYVRNFLSRHAWMRLQSLLLISGAFAGFRARAVVEVGGFDTECMVEDYELIHRLYRYSRDKGLDWRVRVVGDAIATTDAPASPLAFLRQRRRWFGGFLQTQYWNRDMVGNRRYGWLGIAMLPVKALDTLQPIYGLVAFAVLIWLVAHATFAIALPILLIMIAKVVLDLSFHLWSLQRYKAWTGHGDGLGMGPALVASLLEPFSFQLLRHAGATWGWVAFLTGGGTWNRQKRTAITSMVVE
ncbi:MAG TPA: glycosyltransferase [Sphingobium sp.]|uniref:glycosyltransferase family 2 protein n=1 Tax=Sphingobium sp. TaxID=1912891 RepID=UPI002ED040BB